MDLSVNFFSCFGWYRNPGKVRYTKGHMPYKAHYFEVYQTRKESMQREKFFKTIDGYNWLKLQKII